MPKIKNPIINRNIKILRKNHLKLTQQEFAERIKIARTTMGNIEAENINVTDRNILDICDKFNVNKSWLITGQGDMLKPQSTNVKISTFLGNVVTEDKETFKSRVVEMLAELTDEEWEHIEKRVDKFLNK